MAAKCFEMPLAAVNSDVTMMSSLMPADAVRMIGIQKKAGEPLVSKPGIYSTCDFPVRLLSVLHTSSFIDHLFGRDYSVLHGNSIQVASLKAAKTDHTLMDPLCD